MSKITGYLIDVEHETARVATLEKSLSGYYRALNCRCIDITPRRIGDLTAARNYEIICDDEGLLRDAPRISAVDACGNPMLCGNLFIVKFDGCDDVTSLDADDIAHLERFIRPQATVNHPEPYPMLHQCEYL